MAMVVFDDPFPDNTALDAMISSSLESEQFSSECSCHRDRTFTEKMRKSVS